MLGVVCLLFYFVGRVHESRRCRRTLAPENGQKRDAPGGPGASLISGLWLAPTGITGATLTLAVPVRYPSLSSTVAGESWCNLGANLEVPVSRLTARSRKPVRQCETRGLAASHTETHVGEREEPRRLRRQFSGPGENRSSPGPRSGLRDLGRASQDPQGSIRIRASITSGHPPGQRIRLITCLKTW